MPGEGGKWFATAKSLKRLDLAIELAWRSPCDPKTLTRAARDHLGSQPAFAGEAAPAALHWMSLGHGYDLSGDDVREAYRYAMAAAGSIGQAEQVKGRVDLMLDRDNPAAKWIRQAPGISRQ